VYPLHYQSNKENQYKINIYVTMMFIRDIKQFKKFSIYNQLQIFKYCNIS
jgi:hypothetical protein